MKNIFCKILVGMVFLLVSQSTIAQVNITGFQTPLALAQKIAGQGVTISNPTMTCPAQANGIFKVISSNLGLDSGIILTTGKAATVGASYGANGPQFTGTNANASTNNGAPGDPQLTALAGQTTYDACSLEFDVVPSSDTLKFQYVFGSEEYINSVCAQYNDVFAFFISGPGIVGQQNIALIPGTTVPVAVNSVNNGIPGTNSNGTLSACNLMGPGSPFTSYYVNNSTGTTITYDGFTTVLSAVKGVTPCSTYHLKLAIADAGNGIYDSGVFLKAGSLSSGTTSLTASGVGTTGTGIPYCVKGCTPGTFIIKISNPSPNPITLNYILGGSAINGVDYANIGNSATIPANDSQAIITVNGLPTISAGIKSVTLYLNIGCVIDSATIFIYDAPYAQLMTHDTTICLGSSTPIFVNMDTMLAIVWTPIIGLSNPNTPNPIATPLITTTYSFTTSWAGSGCTPISDSLTIAILPQILLTATSNEPICAGATLQLNAIANPPNPQYHYQWTGPNNFTDTLSSPIINNVATDVVGTYTVTASLSSLSGCNGSATVDVTLISTPPPAVAPLILCLHTPAEAITAIGQNLLWYSDAASIIGISHAPVPNTENTGETHYYVTQTINGCTSPKSDIEVNVIECCKGSILIPSAFSPNGDGKNDLFRILVNPGYRIIEFRIYNRWGQVVYEGSKTSDGWDGTFEGKPLDMGTYYYYAQITCVGPYNILSEQKGDFMLIR